MSADRGLYLRDDSGIKLSRQTANIVRKLLLTCSDRIKKTHTDVKAIIAPEHTGERKLVWRADAIMMERNMPL